MNKLTAGLVSLGAVLGAGLVGAQFGPQRPREAIWYAALRKPGYTPPGPAIGAAWGVLETLLWVTGWRLLNKPPGVARGAALTGWAATLAGLAGYPAMFFGAKKLGPSAMVATGMLTATTVTAVSARKADGIASAAMVPLVLWTAFAVLLSEEVWRKN